MNFKEATALLGINYEKPGALGRIGASNEPRFANISRVRRPHTSKGGWRISKMPKPARMVTERTGAPARRCLILPPRALPASASNRSFRRPRNPLSVPIRWNVWLELARAAVPVQVADAKETRQIPDAQPVEAVGHLTEVVPQASCGR